MRERWQYAYLFLGGRSCVLEDSHMRLILTSKRNIRNILFGTLSTISVSVPYLSVSVSVYVSVSVSVYVFVFV